MLLLLLGACAVDEPGLNFPLGEQVDTAQGQTPVLVAAHFGGAYLGTEEYNIGCSMSGDWLSIDVTELDTDTPRMPIRNIDCDPIDESTGYWILHCRQYVAPWWPAPGYWDDFTFVLYPLTWRGTLFWLKDGLDVFHCIHTFEITETELTYEWR